MPDLLCLKLVRQLNRARARGQHELAQQLAERLAAADAKRGRRDYPKRDNTGVIKPGMRSLTGQQVNWSSRAGREAQARRRAS